MKFIKKKNPRRNQQKTIIVIDMVNHDRTRRQSNKKYTQYSQFG